MEHPDTRNTINLEQAQVLSHQAFAGDQYILRLHSPETARDAKPGNFVHLRCDEALPMRRPMSIMRADAAKGWIDILYKAHGLGTGMLARRRVGDECTRPYWRPVSDGWLPPVSPVDRWWCWYPTDGLSG